MSDQILGVAHGVSSKMSQYRELMPGVPYAPPPLPSGKTFLSQITLSEFETLLEGVEQKDWLKIIQQNFYGWGGDILKYSVGQSNNVNDLYENLFALEAAGSLLPAISVDKQTYRLLDNGDNDQWVRHDSLGHCSRV